MEVANLQEYFDSALKFDPKNADALFNKANILLKLKEFKMALETLEEVKQNLTRHNDSKSVQAGKVCPEDQQIKVTN